MRCHLLQAAGQLLGGTVGEVGKRVVGLELAHLRRHGVDDLLSPMADVAVPQAGGRIEKTVTVLRPDVAALALDDDELSSANGGHMRLAVPERRLGRRSIENLRHASPRMTVIAG